ncbi:hypothetical protein D3C79_778490 [compost metagenome]
MRSHQHAVDPGSGVAVQGLVGLPLRAVETGLPTCAQFIAGQAGITLIDRKLAVVRVVAQVVLAAAQLQQAEIGEQVQGARIVGDGELYFAFEQAHQALLDIEAHIGGAAGVQLQHAAVVERLAATLAHWAAVVGKQGRQRVVLLESQSGGAAYTQDQQGFEGSPTTGRTRSLQRCMGQR